MKILLFFVILYVAIALVFAIGGYFVGKALDDNGSAPSIGQLALLAFGWPWLVYVTIRG